MAKSRRKSRKSSRKRCKKFGVVHNGHKTSDGKLRCLKSRRKSVRKSRRRSRRKSRGKKCRYGRKKSGQKGCKKKPGPKKSRRRSRKKSKSRRRKRSKSSGGYERQVGSRAQVWHGTVHHTAGGLTKSDLNMNKNGRIVSKAMQARGRKLYQKFKDVLQDNEFEKSGRKKKRKRTRKRTRKR